MEVLAKGQLSYMILSCLSERDMYGLELIDEIKLRYGVEVKLPSLYSNINRMKELKYIYSYLKESTKGPKCSYSSITELGRSEFVKLQEEFGHLKAEAKKPENDFEQALSTALPPVTPVEEEAEDDYSDFFNLDAEEEKPQPPTQEPAPVEEKEPEQPEYEINIVQSEPVADQTPLVAVVDEPKQVDEEVKTHNEKLYAAAKDFSRNKNKRSYSENQIELALSTAPARTEDEKAQDLSELKAALLSSRQGYYEQIAQPKEPEEEVKQQEVQPTDDGRFITDRINEDDIPKPKRIEPARLNVSIPNYDKSLPAPRRNVAVDPTVSDVKAKLESLYAKAETKKEPQKVEVQSTTESYEDLKKYYASQDVDFKVYERPAKRPKHNTNLLKLYISLFIFALVGVGSGLFYMIFSLCKLTSNSTNFVYYLFPIIALVYVVYNYYNFKTMVSRVPDKLWHPAVVWSIFALMIVAIFLINYACGTPFDQASSYFSTILVPIFASACGTVGLYYSTLFAFKKFWK